jgi:hypothetical protein
MSASQEGLCSTELLMLLFKVTSSKFSAADSKSPVKEIPYYVKPKIPLSFVKLHILDSILSQHAYNSHLRSGKQ